MSIHCNVCQSSLSQAAYESKTDMALTSLCAVVKGHTQVWSCHNCGHIMTRQLLNAEQYYAEDYKILLSHDDEDQIYEMHGDKVIYRTQHQLNTLLKKISLNSNSRVLDYGCAKAAMPRQLLEVQPSLQIHLFDVSEMYKSHWAQFLPADRWAVNQTPASWRGSFDLVTSYFALEHIDEPVASMKAVADLLTDDGAFYGIVPDTVGNVADFIVIDHVNHFTVSSLHVALKKAGFTEIHIDDQSHRGALVFVARKRGDSLSAAPDLDKAVHDAHKLASYWSALSENLAQSTHTKVPSAIYGSGFYGAFIASALGDASSLRCFLDASPYQQGKTLKDLPILAPQDLPPNIKLLYIGLNPAIARKTVAQMSWLAQRDLKIVFLDTDLHD